MSEDKTLTKIPHFDGHYDHWSELMENLLRAKGLWKLIENGFKEPTDQTLLTEAQKAQQKTSKPKIIKSSTTCIKQLTGMCLNKSWTRAHPRSCGTP